LTQIKQAAQIGQSLQSNKNTSYELLVQISNSTQPRVRFSKIEYDGAQTVKIEGTAFSDQDILNFVAKLKTQKGILDATLSSVSVVQQQQQQGISTIPSKSFVVVCQSKGA
jgi:Tfp pilus assembly protein PilN